jgi:hypothetical protein
LGTAEDFVVFLRWVVTPGKLGNDGAVREQQCPFPIGLDCYIVAQNGAQIIEVAFFVGHGDQPPVAVSEENFVYEDRGSLLSGVFRCGG